jgi:hypothetical protein
MDILEYVSLFHIVGTYCEGTDIKQRCVISSFASAVIKMGLKLWSRPELGAV